MAPFVRLVRFKSDDGETYFADTVLGIDCVVTAFAAFDDLLEGKNPRKKLIAKLLSPLIRPDIPIHCVGGTNYRSHALEASTHIHPEPTTYTKPATALANTGDDIFLNEFRAESWPDYEGELVFVTSKGCRDISPEEAPNYILGYTIGNDLTCRMHQFLDQQGGQFYFTRAFDQFAPIGPALVHASVWESSVAWGAKLITTLNGEVVQETLIDQDMIFTPAKILSSMSQGTTIPAGTAIMTGTPAGAGMHRRPRRFLQDGDVVEVSIDGIGTLTNRIRFEQG